MNPKIMGMGGRTRGVLNALKKHPGVIDTQSYLRLEKQLGTQSSITFDVLNNQGAQTVNEKRLAITDSFVITSLSILFYTYDTTVANSQEKTALQTFPDANVFAGAGEADSLQGIYNGFLSVRVNSVVYIDSLDIYRFYRVGVAQQGVETTTTPSSYLRSQWSNGDYGFYGLTPTIELSGATKNEITITLPSNISVAPAANYKTFVVCYMRGLLRQNNAQFNPRAHSRG